jgi:hypothetical protein
MCGLPRPPDCSLVTCFSQTNAILPQSEALMCLVSPYMLTLCCLRKYNKLLVSCRVSYNSVIRLFLMACMYQQYANEPSDPPHLERQWQWHVFWLVQILSA